MGAVLAAIAWIGSIFGALLLGLAATVLLALFIVALPTAFFFLRALKADWKDVQASLSAPREDGLKEDAESLISGRPRSDVQLPQVPAKANPELKATQSNTDGKGVEDPEAGSALLNPVPSDGAHLDDFASPGARGESNKSTTPLFGRKVAVVIPALNEEASLPATLERLNQLQPAVSVVVVADGGSSDATENVAEARGAIVINCPEKGRAKQMNAGAREAAKQMREQDDQEGAESMMGSATGDSIICFLHADTKVPLDLVTILQSKFAEPATCCVGLVPLISVPGRVFWVGSFFGTAKTWFAAFLQSPGAFFRGLRTLYGDQAISCCARDFFRVGGFDENIALFEDADLCERLHNEMGPGGLPGKVSLVPRLAVTSGRRFEKAAWRQRLSNLYLAWRYLRRASPEEIEELYKSSYKDIR